jgi:hypothetical protein
MASLLDLTVQGDVGTISDESKLPQIQLMTPLELYRLWERQNWVSHQIDLSADRRHWQALSENERDQMLYGLSAFFVGEERVTNQFSGLVLAADDKNEEAFLLSAGRRGPPRPALQTACTRRSWISTGGSRTAWHGRARTSPTPTSSSSMATWSRTTAGCSPIPAVLKPSSTSSPPITW